MIKSLTKSADKISIGLVLISSLIDNTYPSSAPSILPVGKGKRKDASNVSLL
jgi:hypothetical protein